MTSLTEVTWLGKKLPVRSERLKLSLVKLQQVEGELGREEGGQKKMEVYEQLLMECQDTMQIVREEISSEPVSVCVCMLCARVCAVCMCVWCVCAPPPP